MENIFTENLNTILAGVITTLIAIIGIVAQRSLSKIKQKLELQATSVPEEHEEDIGLSLMCDRAIMDIIAETRVRSEAQRAYVIRFHNGTYFSNRQPMWKLTCSHESTAKGVEYKNTTDVRDLPASNVLDLIVPFWGGISRGVERIDISDPSKEGSTDPRNGVYYIQTDKLDSSMAKQLLRSQDVCYMINAPLISPVDGRVIGLFGLDFITPCPEDFPPQEKVKEYKSIADRIAYILERSAKMKE